MGYEIERKFLVVGNQWKKDGVGILYRQGYLSTQKEGTVRVRCIEDSAFLTVKGKNVGIRRLEFEYVIPLYDAETMLNNLCEQPIIEKYRYRITYKGFTWEVDEFLGENAGLVIAEIELDNEEQSFARPPWIGKEVSQDARYFNSALSIHPYRSWPDAEK
ncbi:MAG TPA: CYTH domain-containing protein [Desulfobulbaceae bacterium]|nr:CYTH domain-containing protein [Desulfobulbaceae bacterium]